MSGPDPLSVGRLTALAKAVTFIVTADPIRLPVCETVIIHDGRGFRWNRRLALHRLPNGRLEQKLVGRQRKPRPIEVVVAVALLLVAIVVAALLLGLAHWPV
jgi:hypothetical protein